MSLTKIVMIKIISIFLTIVITAGITIAFMNPFGPFEFVRFLSFNLAVHRINTLYHGEVSAEQLFDGAMRGIFEAVGDEYTRFISRQDAEAFTTMLEGSFQGVGIMIAESLDNDDVIIVEVFPDSPAENAGLLSGDVILEVDGEEVFESAEASRRIRGPEGTTVIITLRRFETGEIEEITVTRGQVFIPTVETRRFDNDIAYFAISQFARTTADEFTDKLLELDFKPTGIIIDLRNNGGGIIDVAVEIADIFLPRGTLVVYSEGRGSSRREYRAINNNYIEIPIVLIVNQNSASASEILLGALRDHARAISVGETTFGKGVVQTSLPAGGGRINITSARYFTPNGYDIDGQGIEPDIVVSLPDGWFALPAFLMLEQDTQLQTAIRELERLISE